MSEERLAAWFNGQLPDAELSDAEVAWLEKQVFKAIKRKLQAEGRCVTSSKSIH
jgi:hypothetical protein